MSMSAATKGADMTATVQPTGRLRRETHAERAERAERSYERLVAAAIEATNAAPLASLAGQRDRYELAKRIADETGCAAVSVLPIINGRYHARASQPPVGSLGRDCGYTTGYTWTEASQ